jgi:hypothetical protein
VHCIGKIHKCAEKNSTEHIARNEPSLTQSVDREKGGKRVMDGSSSVLFKGVFCFFDSPKTPRNSLEEIDSAPFPLLLLSTFLFFLFLFLFDQLNIQKQ